MRHKASIFRFLALQKRAFNALAKYQVDAQEQRIKKEFAMKLYYKRLLDRGMSSLIIYRDYKQHRRNHRSSSRSPVCIGSRNQSVSPGSANTPKMVQQEYANGVQYEKPDENQMSETCQFVGNKNEEGFPLQNAVVK